MYFGEAITAAKEGKRIQRKGWNRRMSVVKRQQAAHKERWWAVRHLTVTGV